MNLKAKLEQNGFHVLNSIFTEEELDWTRREITLLAASKHSSARRGRVFGARNVLQILPSLRKVVEHESLSAQVRQLIGGDAQPTRCLFFDKNSYANWHVLWHQDLTIAVREHRAVMGFGPWTIKAGIPHVQPTASILDKMLAVRIHLDNTDESNGALRVIPGSHRKGRLTQDEINELVATTSHHACAVDAGGVLFIKPLLVHSSLACKFPIHRRVLHVEFSAVQLPGGLEFYGN